MTRARDKSLQVSRAIPTPVGAAGAHAKPHSLRMPGVRWGSSMNMPYVGHYEIEAGRHQPRGYEWVRTLLRVSSFVTIALALFSLGFAAAHVHRHYSQQAECQRWQANVNRWADVVSNAPGESTPIVTTLLLLARGGMIAVRDQACGY